jgi:glycosyltransferase involved in cell wall biosynthesis
MSFEQMSAHHADATVSVIISSDNPGDLGGAIESVLSQTRPADEIIVMDHGGFACSETAAICAGYRVRVKYIAHPSCDAASARNAGAAASSGRWIAFLDAGDTWDSEKLEMQLAALAEHAEADFCLTAARIWSVQQNCFATAGWDGSLDPKVMRSELLVKNIFPGLCSSLLLRRSTFQSVGGFAIGRSAEDRRFAITLLERHRGLILPHPLIQSRKAPSQSQDPERHRREMLDFIADHADLFSRLDPGGRLFRRALARTHERTGMHYLEIGRVRQAACNLMRSAFLWPFAPAPWQVLVNGHLGRLHCQTRPQSAFA